MEVAHGGLEAMQNPQIPWPYSPTGSGAGGHSDGGTGPKKLPGVHGPTAERNVAPVPAPMNSSPPAIAGPDEDAPPSGSEVSRLAFALPHPSRRASRPPLTST